MAPCQQVSHLGHAGYWCPVCLWRDPGVAKLQLRASLSHKNRKAQRDYDEHLYKERHLVECFIGKIKYYRRIFSRFEKLASRFLGFLSFVSALIWLR